MMIMMTMTMWMIIMKMIMMMMLMMMTMMMAHNLFWAALVPKGRLGQLWIKGANPAS